MPPRRAPGQGGRASFLPPFSVMDTGENERCRTGLEPERHDLLHPELDHWRANVGGPVALDGSVLAAPRMTGIDLLSWNVAIGLGRLPELLQRLRDGQFGGAGMIPGRPLVLLLQEVFRSDESVPRISGSAHLGTELPIRTRLDIVAFARENGFSLRYSPSMRNGLEASDRGNAILSNVRLTGARALLLPHVRQRRVAVLAQLDGHPELTFISAHLDTHGRLRRLDSRRRRGSGRSAQAATLAAHLKSLPGSVVIGADLNSMLGMMDPAVRTLLAAGFKPAHERGGWRHTFHTPLRLLLDHVLVRSPDRHVSTVSVQRLDEAADDRGRSVFGSDHHPLLARLELRDSNEGP